MKVCTALLKKNPRQNNHQYMRQGSFGIIHRYERMEKKIKNRTPTGQPNT
jgi:hypothetical protein